MSITFPDKPKAEPITQLDLIRQRQPRLLPESILQDYVRQHFEKRDHLLKIWEEHGRHPLYFLDRTTLCERAASFRSAFESVFDETGFYFAMKSNNHPEISRALLDCGFGLDVSSGLELSVALNLGATDIVFSGPGKTDDELKLAVANSDNVAVLIDSFGELERLEQIAGSAGRRIRAGMRLTPPIAGGWRKFGVPIDRMREFFERAKALSSVQLEGIQFHTSWNLDPSAQIETIEALGRELSTWPKALREKIRFLDIGGGFWPAAGEWLQEAATPVGQFEAALGRSNIVPDKHYYCSALSIEGFASRLARTIRGSIHSLISCRICLEPGRWICNESMHIVMQVTDKKEDDLIITDAGTNAVGWERFEQDYVPILNLSRPAVREQECLVCGSLCTPHDVWGYSYWGDSIEPGDVLLVPDQGAYTYSLRQEFIKPLPEVLLG